MGRRKINLEIIENSSKRHATFMKRKACVFKKARELSTLCGVRLCVIVDSPFEAGYEVFPSEEEATEVALMYKNKNMPKKDKSAMKAATTPEPDEIMLQQQVMETQEQILRLELENHELQSEILMHEYMTGARGITEIGPYMAESILGVAQKRLRAVRARIDALSSEADNAGKALASGPAIAAQPEPEKEKVEDTVDTRLHL